MAIEYDLSKLKPFHSFRLTFIFGALLIAPCFFLFQFETALFYRLDLIRLILISMAISLPVLCINWFLQRGEKLFIYGSLIDPDDDDKEVDRKADLHVLSEMMGASVNTILVFYVPCFQAYFSEKHVTARQATQAATGMEFTVILLAIILAIVRRVAALRKHRKALAEKASKQPPAAGANKR